MEAALLIFLACLCFVLSIKRWQDIKRERNKKYALFVLEIYREPDGDLLQRQRTLAVYDSEDVAIQMCNRQSERDRIEKERGLMSCRYFVLEFNLDEGVGLGVAETRHRRGH